MAGLYQFSFILVLVSTGCAQQNSADTCSADTCRLPDCFCAGTVAPMSMEPSLVPQMVMFTFDDAINEQVRVSLTSCCATINMCTLV